MRPDFGSYLKADKVKKVSICFVSDETNINCYHFGNGTTLAFYIGEFLCSFDTKQKFEKVEELLSKRPIYLIGKIGEIKKSSTSNETFHPIEGTVSKKKAPIEFFEVFVIE